MVKMDVLITPATRREKTYNWIKIKGKKNLFSRNFCFWVNDVRTMVNFKKPKPKPKSDFGLI